MLMRAWYDVTVVGVPRFETQDAVQVPKGDAEQVAEKKRTMKFSDVDVLAFSYKELVKIENLAGFDNLTKLKLDCNRITTIEGLSHLVRMGICIHIDAFAIRCTCGDMTVYGACSHSTRRCCRACPWWLHCHLSLES